MSYATWKDVSRMVEGIVDRSFRMCHANGVADISHVSYVAIFSQSDSEYQKLHHLATDSGGIVGNETSTGDVFVVPPLNTVAGTLRIVKVRKPDPTRLEVGDADFCLRNYSGVKSEYLSRPGFSLVVREEFEMIELLDPRFDVRAYFSHPPVEEHGRLPEVLRNSDLG